MTLKDIYDFSTYSNLFLCDDLISEMAALFSEHYGVWDSSAPNPGKNVKLSAKLLKQNYLAETSEVVIAREKSSQLLVGYAIAVKKKYGTKRISWINQFVVHKDHRNKKIGTIVVTLNGDIIEQVDIMCKNGVEKKKWSDYIIEFCRTIMCDSA